MLKYFSKFELMLWSISVLLILSAFLIFDRESYITLISSVIGVTSLIFNAKGNPVGQFLIIIFSILYGYISYSFAYYGEMLTYLAMTMPMAVISLFSWLKNPYKGNKAQVKVNNISKREITIMWLIAAPITIIFYFILKYFNTANIYPSTLSVTTSFVAVYLTFKRSPFYAVGYAVNDAVLILLWILAGMENTKYISVAVCFAVFFVNDAYGYASWKRLQKIQTE